MTAEATPERRGPLPAIAPDGSPRRWSRVIEPRAWLALLGSLTVLLAGTGVWQARHYRPQVVPSSGGPAQSWDHIDALHDPRYRGAGWVSALHRDLAWAFVLAAVALVLSIGLRWVRTQRIDGLLAAWLGVGAVAVMAAVASGRRLPFGGFGMRVIRLDLVIGGVWGAAFDPAVRSVFTNSGEVPPGHYRALVLAHLVGAPLVVALALVVAWRRSRPGEGR
jgi:hypothetical protein